MIWANDQHSLDAGEHSVLSVVVYRLLGNEGQPRDQGWTTKRILGRACGLTDKNARYALARLEARGLLKVTSKVGRAVGYLGLHVPRLLGAKDHLKPRPLGSEPDEKRGCRQPLLAAVKGAVRDPEKGLSAARKRGRRQPPNLLMDSIEENPLINHHPPPPEAAEPKDGAPAPVAGEDLPAARDGHDDGPLQRIIDELAIEVAQATGRPLAKVQPRIAALAEQYGLGRTRSALRDALEASSDPHRPDGPVRDVLGWARGRLQREDDAAKAVRAKDEAHHRLYAAKLLTGDPRPFGVLKNDPSFLRLLEDPAVIRRALLVDQEEVLGFMMAETIAEMSRRQDAEQPPNPVGTGLGDAILPLHTAETTR